MNSARDKVLATERQEEVTSGSAKSHSNKSGVMVDIIKSPAHSSFLLAVSSPTGQQQNKKIRILITCYFVLRQWQYQIIHTNIISYWTSHN